MCMIIDESVKGRPIINVWEASSQYEPGDYGKTDAPNWHGDVCEAGKIIERLTKETGHRFKIIMD